MKELSAVSLPGWSACGGGGVLKMPDVNRNGRGSEPGRDLLSVTQATIPLCQHEGGSAT